MALISFHSPGVTNVFVIFFPLCPTENNTVILPAAS